MRFTLNKEEKLAFPQAATLGVLDTRKIPRIAREIQGSNAFLELMMELDAQADEQAQTGNTDKSNKEGEL